MTEDTIRYDIPSEDIPAERLQELVEKCSSDLANMKLDRQDWLDKYEEFLMQYDDFMTPARKGPWNGSSNVHVPFTLAQMRAFHARLMAILFDVTPYFYLITDSKTTKEKKRYHEVLLQWALESLCNYGEGCFDTIDKWIWKGVELGNSWIRLRWEEQREKFIDVESIPDPETGEMAQQEVEVDKVVYSGPVMEVIDKLNFYMPAGQNIRNADPVFCRLFWSPDQLRRLQDSPGFIPGNIDELLTLKAGDNPTGEEERGVLQAKEDLQGVKMVDKNLKRPGYRIIETITQFDINGDGKDEKVVLWYDEDHKIPIGWTYFYRIHINGRPPYYKFTFMPRDLEDLGLVELLYQTNNEMDAMRNMRIDSGTLQNMPWGTRKNSRSVKADDVRIAPGRFINVEDHDDIQIKSFPNPQNFFVQAEESVRRDGERLSLSSLAFSQQPDKVGALGTASGAMALLNEGNKQVDIHIKRLQNSWKELLRGIYHLIRERLPEDTKFGVTGQNGQEIHYELFDREWLLSDIDFRFVANTAMLNKETLKQEALMAHQTLLNPLHVQMGVVSAENIMNSLKDTLRAMGKHNVIDYVNENAMDQKPLATIEEEVSSIIRFQMPPIGLNDNHQAKIQGLEFFMNGIEMQHYKKENPAQAQHMERLFQQAIQAHQEMLDAIQAQAAQAGASGLQIAPNQMNRAAGMGTSQESPEGEGAPMGGGMGSNMQSGGSERPQ